MRQLAASTVRESSRQALGSPAPAAEAASPINSRRRAMPLTIASPMPRSPTSRSVWRPSAGRATGGASRDAVGLLTPPLLLRRERGQQAPADRGFRSGRNPPLRAADASTVPLRQRAAVGFEPRACRTLGGMQARAPPLRQQCGRGDPRFRIGRTARESRRTRSAAASGLALREWRPTSQVWSAWASPPAAPASPLR